MSCKKQLFVVWYVNTFEVLWPRICLNKWRIGLPKGPQSQKRPADSIGMSVRVAQIATGEVQETPSKSGRRASGLAGAKARSAALSAERKSEIARAAAQARWN